MEMEFPAVAIGTPHKQLRRTNADKRRAVQLAVAHPYSKTMSNRALAKYLGLSHSLIGKIRSSTGRSASCVEEFRIGLDGKRRKIKAAKEAR